jgi:hypothetical protein
MKKIFSLSLVLLLTACASNNKIANQVSTIGKPGDIEITDLSKAKDLETSNTVVRWKFNTTSNKAQQVFWRCDFFDANGFVVGEPTRFVQATIHPEQALSETCTFPSDRVVDFKINFQNIATNMTVYN